MAFNPRRFRQAVRARRETLWLFVATVESTLSGGPTAVLANSLSAAALALRPFTIVRTRGIIHIRSDQAAATETYAGDLGYAVVSDQAAAIGITAVPTPFTDLASDLWFFHQIMDGSFVFVSGVGFTSDGVGSSQRDFESKGMRKVNGDQDVVFTLETSTLSSGAILYAAGRILIKLH